jgi:DNA helicase-2/ATP-dependent DNA helicase PcrA
LEGWDADEHGERGRFFWRKNEVAEDLIQRGMEAYERGEREKAGRLFALALRKNARDERAWFGLSQVVEEEDRKRECLEWVLAINPQHPAALAALEALSVRAGSPEDLPDFLTPQQREAITHRGSPLLIIAGPGSGKTEVISWRVAHLVRSGYVGVGHVLAVTFTEKAALELKDRIQGKMPEANVERMQISTLHSFAALLLRRYAAFSPLPRGFRILDETGQFLFVYSNRKAFGLGEIIKGRPQDFFAAVIRTFNLATEEMVEPGELESWCEENVSRCSEKETGLWQERQAVAEAYRRYGLALQEGSLVDFAFLQRHAVRLLEEHPDTREALQQEYREVLVDEYQDTNAAQEKLIGLLAGDGKHLTVVGDDDQSIYRFRGATVKNILSFSERYPGAQLIKLPHNFRSLDPIVDHSLEVIAHNPARYPKDLQGVRGEGSEVLLVYEHSAAEEAEAVVGLIRRLHEARRISQYGDVAILLRSVKSYAAPYIDALAAEGIPYQVIGDASLFEREEIAQIYEVFNFFSTTKAWGDKYLRGPLVGLRSDTCRALRATKDSLYDLVPSERAAGDGVLQKMGVHNPRDRARLLRLLEIKRKVQAQEHGSILEIFYDVLAATGCVARLERAGEASAIANLGVLSRLVAAWDEYGSTRNFYPFREYLKLVKDSGVDPTLPPAEDVVRIMTIHQAKGLEFPVVVLGAAMDGRLPSRQRGDPYEIPYQLRDSGEPEVPDFHLVDERKLFYVAATRARDLLIVGTADVVNKRGGGPSPFLREMFGPDLQAAAEYSEEKVQRIESRPPSDHGPRPRHSFSQLATYLQCPLRYKFAVVYGLEVPWLDPVDFGANVHCCLEAIHQRAIRGESVQPDDLPELIAQVWLSTPRSSEEEEAAYRQAALRQLTRYLEEHGERLRDSRQAETFFSFPLEEDVLLGKVDLIRKTESEGVEIVDFKTSSSAAGEMEGVALQLGLYALGVESGLGIPVARQVAHFLEDGQTMRWAWTPERKERAEAEIAELLDRIHAQQFPPRRAYCGQCTEFRAICPDWNGTRTSAENADAFPLSYSQ